MFTGIVEDMGTVESIDFGAGAGLGVPESAAASGGDTPATSDARITITTTQPFDDIASGDSVAVEGVCLTVTDLAPAPAGGTRLMFDVMPQTLKLSSLGGLKDGSRVNLERAMRADGRLNGHIVQGHVDGVTTLRSRTPGPLDANGQPRWDELRFDLPPGLGKYLVPQGSVTLAGTSLTVSNLDDDGFTVSLIPTTLAVTTLGSLQVGDQVNVEVDVLGKYIERLLGGRAADLAPEQSGG